MVEVSDELIIQHEDFMKEINTNFRLIWKTLKNISPYVHDAVFSELHKKNVLREVYLTELFEGIEKISLPLEVINEESGQENHVDLLYVVAIAKYLQAKNIFEFGTYFGKTTYFLAATSDDTHVTTLDFPPDQSQTGDYQGSYFKNSDREHQITQLLADSKKFDPLPYKRLMNLIFVDGDHSYTGISHESKKALKMLAPGGVIIWHDYAAKTPDVVRYFNDFTAKKPVFHIKRTSLIVYIDGVDPLTFNPPKRMFTKNNLR